MPTVSGLFSGLDLRAGAGPSIEVTTAVHATHTRLHQSIAWIVAALCAVAALLLVSARGTPQPVRAIRHALRYAAAQAHPVDAVVGIVLLAWWILSPAFADDGWVIARERMFSSSGGFSHYYNAFAANIPNDYWLEWVQHWLAGSSLVVLRVTALLCLAATWILGRWILYRILQSSSGQSAVALWALASGFLTVALAWGMTLRPEPVTALLITAVLASTIRFLERGTGAPLAAIAVLLPLALTAHHAAVAAFGPLVVAAPRVVRWCGRRIAVAATIATSAVAFVVVLFFVGADLEQRSADAKNAPLFQATTGWRDELLRYFLVLDVPPYATPLRRGSVVLIALVVIAFLLRPRRSRQPLLDLPAASLGVALLLFVAAPTKHSWHFGALVGLVAIAAATETARFRSESARSDRGQVRSVVTLGVVLLAIAWSWFPRRPWNEVDLRTLDWTLGFERALSLSTLALALPLVVLGALVVVDVVGGRRLGGGFVSWRVAPWTVPLLAAPLIVFTVGVFAADAEKTSSWTLTRQNLSALIGDAGCGLADDLVVPVLGSAPAPFVAIRSDPGSLPGWVPPAPVENVPRFALGPVREGSAGRSPWFRFPSRGNYGFFISGEPQDSDLLELEWGRLFRGDVEPLETERISNRFASEAGAVVTWRFLARGELPSHAEEANVVRIVLRSRVTPGVALAVTAPVTYSNETLTRRLSRRESSLVMPSLVTFFPCARLPRLGGGVVDPPGEIVLPRSSLTVLRFTGSPFQGILDLYGLERLPLSDSENPPSEVVVFGVDHRLPGGAMASPTRELRVG
ncbi:MAG: arabinosyltransferase, partial [Actinomycetota bacterium]|nr:arabinosyltransferase [Actinomycetota bacterium]